MEKPGMGRRYSRIGAGLLGFLTGIAAVLCPVFSEETGYFPDPDYYMDYGMVPETASPAEFVEDLEVLLETSPETPEVHAEWRVCILVNHPNPQEVSVRIPDLPSSLVLDRFRTAVRFIRHDEAADAEEKEKWTAVDFFFTPGQGGPVSLAPFEVRVPGGLGHSPPVSVRVRGGNEEAGSLWAVWEPTPVSLTAGQSAEVRLRFMTGKMESPQAASVLYRPEPPVNAIIESLGVMETGPGEFLLRFRIIPLEGDFISIPPTSLKYENASLIVPGREFSVLPAIPAASAVPSAQSPAPIPDQRMSARTPGNAKRAGEEPSPALIFPDASDPFFPPFRKGYERALEEGRSYWDRGLYAEALASLRLNERELAAGPTLAPLRRSAENALGIGFTEDEKWRPRWFFMVLAAVVSFILPVLLISGGGGKNFTVTSGFSRGYTFIVIFFCIIMGGLLYGIFSGPGRVTRPGRGRTGILREANVFRLPEDGNVTDTFFREGEPVRIRSLTDAWAYVESFEGKAGWVPLDRIIPY